MKLNTKRELPAGTACACCGATAFTPWMTVPERTGATHDYRLVRCSSCSHIWLADPPSPDELQHFYGPAYHQAISCSGDKDPVRWSRQLQVIMQYKTHGSVLDIGCSSGGFLAFLRAGPWQLAGIEASPKTAEKARRATGGAIFNGDVVDANFAPASFDVITCSDVLEHLYEPRLVFNMVQNWLKPGGIFYIFVPNIQSWEARAFGTWWCGLDLPRHLHHYSVDSLRALAKSACLRPVHIVTPVGTYVEQSASLWLTDRLRKGGSDGAQVNLSGPGPLPWRVLRKALRLTAEATWAKIGSSCGAGPSLQAVFQKPMEPAVSPVHPQATAPTIATQTLARVTEEVAL